MFGTLIEPKLEFKLEKREERMKQVASFVLFGILCVAVTTGVMTSWMFADPQCTDVTMMSIAFATPSSSCYPMNCMNYNGMNIRITCDEGQIPNVPGSLLTVLFDQPSPDCTSNSSTTIWMAAKRCINVSTAPGFQSTLSFCVNKQDTSVRFPQPDCMCPAMTTTAPAGLCLNITILKCM